MSYADEMREVACKQKYKKDIDVSGLLSVIEGAAKNGNVQVRISKLNDKQKSFLKKLGFFYIDQRDGPHGEHTLILW